MTTADHDDSPHHQVATFFELPLRGELFGGVIEFWCCIG